MRHLFHARDVGCADVIEIVKQNDVRFIRLWFTDVLGQLKSFSVNASELEDAFEGGMGFDGSSITCFNPIEESDMLAVPEHFIIPRKHVELSGPHYFHSTVAQAYIAGATQRIRIGTLVLNTSFYNPTLLARDIATVDRFSGGRVELGLGAGYDKAQFDAAGLPWIAAGERVSLLERTVAEFRKPRAQLDQYARFDQPSGRDHRVLKICAGRRRRRRPGPP